MYTTNTHFYNDSINTEYISFFLDSTRGKIKRNILGKKSFLIVIRITVFINNSNKQELIHHIHFLYVYFMIKARQRNHVDFIRSYSIIFTLNPIHWMSPKFLIQQTSLYSLFIYNIFLYALCLFMVNIIIYQIQKHFWL